MKFWKTTLAVVVGIFIASILSFILFLPVIGLFGSSEKKTTTIPAECMLDLDMSTLALCEQTTEVPDFAALAMGGETVEQIAVIDAVNALEKIAGDPAVKFIYLRPDGLSAGMAELEEFRCALKKVRESGKAIIAYTENPTNGGYYLASVADKIYMTSCIGANSMLGGLSANLTFLGDALKKLGINVQLIRHGKYKSAGEMYVRNSISPENRQQYEELLGSIWTSWSTEMAESRGLTAEAFNALLDDLKLNFNTDFVEHGLVDSLVSNEEMGAKLAELYGAESVKKVKGITLGEYIKAKVVPNYRAKDKIAILYGDGEIVDGKGAEGQMGGDSFSKVVAEVRRDSTIKAVVFRVNSPGGSVLASDKIKKEIDLLQARKPVVASYANYAASGGYWISNSCNRIYADASTLTGSIGVFAMIPDISGVYKDLLHIGTATINTNKHSDMYSLKRPLTKDETEYLQASIEDVYDTFTGLVAEGRGLDQKYVDGIAQGRVWSGNDGVRIGIVDEIGGLKEALEYTATIANGDTASDLSKYQIVSYPKPKTLMETLLESFESQSGSEFKGTVLEDVERAFTGLKLTESGKAYARLPYLLEIK